MMKVLEGLEAGVKSAYFCCSEKGDCHACALVGTAGKCLFSF